MSDELELTDAALDDLLREASSGVQTPEAVRRSVLGAVRRERWRVGLRRAAAAAVVLIAACLPLVLRGRPEADVVIAPAAPEPIHVATADDVPLTPIAVFTPSDDHIVVSCERVAEDVTVVQLLPTVQSEKNQRRRALAQYFQDQVKRRGDPS